MMRILIYSFFILNWFSSIGQTDFLPLKKLMKEPKYLVDAFLNVDAFYYLGGREKIPIDRDVYHPEVKRLQIVDYRADTTLFPVENFPNVQELFVECHGRTDFPSYVTKFNKIQFLSISYSGSDEEEMIYYETSISLPDALFSMKNLKLLAIKGLNIAYIPEKISQLTSLQVLDIDDINYDVQTPFYIAPVSPAFMPKLNRAQILPKDMGRYVLKENLSRILSTSVQEMDLWKTTHIDFNTDNYKTYNYNNYKFYNYDNYDNNIDITIFQRIINKRNYFYYYYNYNNNNPNTSIFQPLKKDYEETYNNLKPLLSHEINTYYENGNKSIEGQIDSLMRPVDEWKFYFPDGKLKQSRLYKDGREVGTWHIYDSLGTPQMKLEFLNDSITHFSYYNVNGVKIKEVKLKNNIVYYESWNNGEKIGTEHTYDSNGRLKTNRFFTYKEDYPKFSSAEQKYLSIYDTETIAIYKNDIIIGEIIQRNIETNEIIKKVKVNYTPEREFELIYEIDYNSKLK